MLGVLAELVEKRDVGAPAPRRLMKGHTVAVSALLDPVAGADGFRVATPIVYSRVRCGGPIKVEGTIAVASSPELAGVTADTLAQVIMLCLVQLRACMTMSLVKLFLVINRGP